MQVAITYFDNYEGPRILISLPDNLPQDRAEFLEKLLDLSNVGFFEHHSHSDDPFAVGTYIVSIKSKWARGNQEHVMMSVITDEKTNPTIFRSVLEDCANELIAEPDIYKGFYMRNPKADLDSPKYFKKIQELVNKCYENCKKMFSLQKPGKMVFYGLQKVGKSSIVNRITSNIFDPNIKPTLGMQVIRSVIDSFDFQIYDFSGQKNTRQSWFDKPEKPNAIIFVFDCTASENDINEAKSEFNRVMDHFYGKDSKVLLDKNTPILILGNKSDLVKNYHEDILEKILQPKRFKANYRIGIVSAKQNLGIEDNFKWLVKAFL